MNHRDKILNIVVVEPNKPAYTKTINHESEAISDVIDGYFEIIKLFDDYILVVNENGKIRNLPHNRALMIQEHTNFVAIHGTFFVTKLGNPSGKGFEFLSMSDEESKELCRIFKNPSSTGVTFV